MFDFIKRMFGGKKVEPAVVKTMAPPPPVPPRYDKSYRTKPQPIRARESDDDGFLTSMAIASLTDSTLLGAAVGGNVAGALIGDMLNDSDSTSSNDNNFHSFGGGDFGGGGAGDSWDNNDSSYDSSYDSSSSFDSSFND